MTPLRSKISIKWIMPPLLVLPVIIVSLVLITLHYQTSRRSIDELADQNTQQIHRNIEEHLSRLIDLPPAINVLNRHMLETGELSFTDMEHNRLSLFQTLTTFPTVSSIVIGTAAGRATWVIRYPGESTYEYALKATPTSNMQEHTLAGDGSISGPLLGDYTFHPDQRPWYLAAARAGAPTWGDVYIWVRHGEATCLGIPYVDPVFSPDHHLLGVINVELTLSDISTYLAKTPVGKTGKSFIIDRNGELVANSVGLLCRTRDLKRLPARDLADPWISAVARQLHEQPGSFAHILGNRHTTIFVDQPLRVVASPFTRTNLSWLIVTLAPDSDFLGPIQSARNRSITIGVIIVLLMILASIATVAAMLRPVLKLVHHVKAVGEGKLGEKIHLTDNLEMVQLSQAVNEMVDGLSDRMRLRHALNVAMDVQQSLLPGSTPAVQGVDVAAFSKYCDETGGDYYDYLDVAGLGENTLVVALGDVMGHGVAAAMLMATARGMLRSRVRVPGSLGDLLTHVNDLLVADTGGTRFMTMLVGVIDTDTNTMRWASAGHDAPFIYDPAIDSFPDIPVPAGLPLGIMQGQPYEESPSISFRPGQVLLIGTDGIWEARNPSEDEFGRERLKQAIRELADRSAREIQAELFNRLKQYCAGNTIADDVTYVVIKFTEKATKTATAADTFATSTH
ncbi:MAG: SpoIIE family protein phosphatase [Phycisphaerae bacterium]